MNDYFQKQKIYTAKLEQSFQEHKNVVTIVEMKKNYADDNAMCLTTLAFPTKTITKKIHTITKRLQAIEPDFYYYPENSLHLTIKNIRTIHKPPLFAPDDVKKVHSLFEKIIPKFPSFHFYIEDIILCPTSVSAMAYSNNTLQKIILALDKGLKKIGIPDDKKYLSPSIFWSNISLCRFTHTPNEAFRDAVKKMRHKKIGTVRVKNINLITCNAVCHPKTQHIVATYALS